MALGRHGEHANVWSNHKADGDHAESEAFDMHLGDELQAFGRAGGAIRVRLQFSQDGRSWYNGPIVDTDDDGDFDIRESGIQARYVRLLALRGPDFKAYAEGEEREEREPMNLTATLVAKTTR